MSRSGRSVILRLVAAGAVLVAADDGARTCSACPICGQPTVTLAERYAKADAALLVAWVASQTAREGQADSTTYEVLETPRRGPTEYRKGDRLTAPGYHAGKPGNLVLLTGRKPEAGDIQWDYPPLDVTETAYQYIVQAPSLETAWEKRLAYFVRFLEFPDLTIANDAFAEFVNAPAKDIAAVAKLLPRDKLRDWLFDPRTAISRVAAYGLMLGLCGEPRDAERMFAKIVDENDERRVGLEGIVVGYLLLTGEQGLARLETKKLNPTDAPEGDVFAVLTALRYLWSYGNGTIPPEKLRRAMRKLVERPQFAASAITDLARWQDWSIQSRLMELYGTQGFDDRETKRAIIGYLIAGTKDVPAGKDEAPPEHARAAAGHLARLREREPRLVSETEKFFYLK
ncbi:MAG: hypothetical protein ACT4QC_04455 [Planctomycetaceae bacterium]